MSQLQTQSSDLANSAPEPILRATGIRRQFKMGDSQIEVLHHVDLNVKAGEFLAIEGRSGSGKSTLLHILGALDGCDGGSVFYDGQDISRLSSSAQSRLRNKHFGFVFQFYHLLPELNVLENTLLGPMIEQSVLSFFASRKELARRGVEVLEQMQLGHRLKHLPKQLSGGERQRVAIARALLNKPKVIFADEPTGNLDSDTGTQIMNVLEKLHQEQNQTILMVTHDRALAREADRVLVLKQGVLERALA